MAFKRPLLHDYLERLFDCHPDKLALQYSDIMAANAFIQAAAFLREDHPEREKFVDFLLDLAEDSLSNIDDLSQSSCYGRYELADVIEKSCEVKELSYDDRF